MASKGGRPAFKATPALRQKVEQLISCGMTQDDVARAIGCSTPTLTKHFEEELTTGAAKKRAEVISMLYRNAKKGNVSAQKALEAMTRSVVAPEAGVGAGADLGKKQQQQAAAERVTGVFAPPEPPKLVVNNT